MSTEVQEIQAALAAIPGKHGQPADNTLAKLPKPLRKDAEKGKCDVCGGWHGLPAIHLDYMGHAEVTLALIEVDPLWTWEPLAIDDGRPAIHKEGNRLVMWARLTMFGKSIIGVGTCEAGKGDPEKELIGDFLRNAAMRFGIGTKLWSKATDADPAVERSGGGYDSPKRGGKPAEPTYLAETVALFDKVKATKGTPTADTLKAFAAEAGKPLTLAALDADPVYAEQVADILNKQVTA